MAVSKKIKKWMKLAFSDVENASLESGLDSVFANDRTFLMRAFEMNDSEIVKSLLKLDAKTDIRNSRGWTSLFFAVRNGNAELLDKLIEAGVSINAMDKLGRTALFYAEDLACAQRLIDADALVDAVDNDGRTPLFFAKTGAMVNFLAEHKADVNAVDVDGRTAIYYASNGETAHALLLNQAQYNIFDYEGITPYDFVRDFEKRNASGVNQMTRETFDALSPEIFNQLGRWEVIELVGKGYNKRLKERISEWPELNVGEIRDEAGDPLLRHFIYSNNTIGMKILIEHGVDVNVVDSHGDFLIFSAILNNNAEILRILCEAGADANVRNAADKTTLRVGFFYRNYDILEQLVYYGADVNLKDELGRTPLFYAQKESLIEAMIKMGADVNALDNYGNSPLFLAESAETIHALVRHKADVNLQNAKQETPLFFINKPKLIRALLEEGALIDMKFNGKTLNETAHGNIILEEMFNYASELIDSKDNIRLKALFSSEFIVKLVDSHGPLILQAVKADNPSAVKFLINAGANVDCIDKYFKTPLMCAIENRSKAFVDLLISANAIVHVEELTNTNDKDDYYVDKNNPFDVPVMRVNCIHNAVKIKHYSKDDNIITNMDYIDLRSIHRFMQLQEYEKKLLNCAIRADDAEILRVLFKAGLSPNLVIGETSGLSQAVNTGNIALIDAFIEADVKIDLTGKENADVLFNAVKNNDAGHFIRLFRIKSVKNYMQICENERMESLIMAVIQIGNTEILKYILDNFSKFKNDKNHVHRENVLNFIRQAIRHRHVEMIKFLLIQFSFSVIFVLNEIIDSDMPEIMNECYKINDLRLDEVMREDMTYIMRAVKRGNVDMVRTMMDNAGITPKFKVKTGLFEMSLTEWALTCSSIEVCCYLIDNCKRDEFDWNKLKNASILPEVKSYIDKKFLT